MDRPRNGVVVHAPVNEVHADLPPVFYDEEDVENLVWRVAERMSLERSKEILKKVIKYLKDLANGKIEYYKEGFPDAIQAAIPRLVLTRRLLRGVLKGNCNIDDLRSDLDSDSVSDSDSDGPPDLVSVESNSHSSDIDSDSSVFNAARPWILGQTLPILVPVEVAETVDPNAEWIDPAPCPKVVIEEVD